LAGRPCRDLFDEDGLAFCCREGAIGSFSHLEMDTTTFRGLAEACGVLAGDESSTIATLFEAGEGIDEAGATCCGLPRWLDRDGLTHWRRSRRKESTTPRQ